MSRRRSIVILAVALLVAAGVVGTLLVLRISGPQGVALTRREHAMELLGASVARLRPGSGVLVLSNPFTREAGYLDPKNEYERAGLRGLRKGLGGHSVVKVAFPEFRPEYVADPQSVFIPPDSRTPLSFLMQPESVERLAEANPDCAVIVSLIGLPSGVDGLKIWEEGNSRSFALLLPDLRLLGPPAQAVQAFERGKIAAAVVEDSQSGEPMIVTRDNVAEVLERQPKVLGY